jgi:hypothetical protein
MRPLFYGSMVLTVEQISNIVAVTAEKKLLAGCYCTVTQAQVFSAGIMAGFSSFVGYNLIVGPRYPGTFNTPNT